MSEKNKGTASSNNPATVKLPNGKEYTLEQIAEFEASGLRQADYTKKTQELAEERRAIAADLEAKTRFAENMEAVFQQDPTLYAKAQEILTGKKPVMPESKGDEPKPKAKDTDPNAEALAKIKFEHDRAIKQLNDQLIDLKIKEAKERTQAKFQLSDEEMELVTARASENFVPGKTPLENLEIAYKTIKFEQNELTRAEQERKAEEAALASFFGGIGLGKGGQEPTFKEILMHGVKSQNGNSIL